MKKLNLLEPNQVKGFLEGGSGEPVSYLHVQRDVTLKALEEDVATGAVQFKDSLEAAKKGLSRVVVIKTDNYENGLMAVNYLAGICNEREGVSDDNDYLADDLSDEFDMDELLNEIEDYYNIYDDDIDSGWLEAPSRVPVVPLEEIIRQSSDMGHFFNQNFVMAGMMNNRNQHPYWMDCTKESICIVYSTDVVTMVGENQLSQYLERFRNNKHLFLLVIEKNCPFMLEDDVITNDHGILSFVLESTADMVMVQAKEESLNQYRILQFDNWLDRLHLKVSKKFPKKAMVEKIISIRNERKSELLKSVLKYVQKESGKAEGEFLDKDDFAILRKFKLLGMEDENHTKYTERLEMELVGMDAVKEQVKSIVQVMKYNKCREQMGLGKGNYHNVHLFIGAPGTAKTTVAKLMGNMMCEENLLPGNRFACVNGADLKGLFVGHSAPKTHQLFEENDIILIDEAYSLVDDLDRTDSFSQEAIAQLIIEIEEHAMDKLVMFAGYGGINVQEKDNKMKKFIDANPGIKSRINSTIFFDSYTPKQMVDIVHVQAKQLKYTLSKDADEAICHYFEERVGDTNFGNGREARSLLENAIVFTAERVMKLAESKRTKKAMSEIATEDIINAIARMKKNTMMQNGRERTHCGFLGIS